VQKKGIARQTGNSHVGSGQETWAGQWRKRGGRGTTEEEKTDQPKQGVPLVVAATYEHDEGRKGALERRGSGLHGKGEGLRGGSTTRMINEYGRTDGEVYKSGNTGNGTTAQRMTMGKWERGDTEKAQKDS